MSENEAISYLMMMIQIQFQLESEADRLILQGKDSTVIQSLRRLLTDPTTSGSGVQELVRGADRQLGREMALPFSCQAINEIQTYLL